jgi:hypothetical protein
VLRRLASRQFVLTAGLALAILLGPLVLRGDPAQQNLLQTNAETIRRMTESERARLERNYKQFLKLPPEEQARWRAFNDKLLEDDQLGQSRLRKAMTAYCNWLQTVPGYRREELSEATSVGDRVELVSATVDEQLMRKLEFTTRWGGRVPVLGPKDLNTAMEKLEEKLPADVRDELDQSGASGFERHIKVLTLLNQRYSRMESVFDGKLLGEIRGALPPELLDLFPERPQGLGQQVMVMQTLRLSLVAEFERERERQRPTPVQIQQVFDALSPQEQETLFQLSAVEFRSQLERMFFQEQYQKRLQVDLGKAIDFMMPEGGRGDPRGGDGARLEGRGILRGYNPNRGSDGRPPFPPGERPFDADRPPTFDGDRPRGDGRDGFGHPGEGPFPGRPPLGDRGEDQRGGERPRPDGPRPEEPRNVPPRDEQRPPAEETPSNNQTPGER